MKEDDSMVEIIDVHFSYGHSSVLNGISLKVKSGEVLTLLGPNGSGKTTLLKCMSGVLRPIVGTVKIAGQNVKTMSARQLAKKVAILHQNHIPVFPYEVQDIVLMGRTPYLDGFLAGPEKDDKDVVKKIMNELGISHFVGRPYTQLSGGERQLVMLARALAQEPSVLVLDEPTAPLDFKNTVGVLSTVRKLAVEKNLVVVMSLHDPNFALLFSDKVALIQNGNLLASDFPELVINNSNLEKLYGIPVEIIQHDGKSFVIPRKNSLGY